MDEQFMKWRPDFNLGIEKIDEEHKKIVELINKLNTAFMNDTADKEIIGILDEMSDYANYHFKNEEAMFTAKNYPFSDEHIALHEKFIKKVADFRMKFESGQAIILKVLGFLRQWLTDHILDADREYAVLVRSNK